MQFKAFEEGIEVNGRTVYAFVDGMGPFRPLGEKYMINAGIGVMKNGTWRFDIDAWYPQQAWLNAFEAIAREVGDSVLYKIGYAIPANAEFPSHIPDICSAVRAVDIAYHMNHRKNGKILYDAENGTMYEGIGHYGCEPVPGKNLIVSISNNPYPCVFDQRIIAAMIQRYDIKAIVVHDDSKPCRKNGAETCTYLISW